MIKDQYDLRKEEVQTVIEKYFKKEEYVSRRAVTKRISHIFTIILPKDFHAVKEVPLERIVECLKKIVRVDIQIFAEDDDSFMETRIGVNGIYPKYLKNKNKKEQLEALDIFFKEITKE